jgi:hypothetical protein
LVLLGFGGLAVLGLGLSTGAIPLVVLGVVVTASAGFCCGLYGAALALIRRAGVAGVAAAGGALVGLALGAVVAQRLVERLRGSRAPVSGSAWPASPLRPHRWQRRVLLCSFLVVYLVVGRIGGSAAPTGSSLGDAGRRPLRVAPLPPAPVRPAADLGPPVETDLLAGPEPRVWLVAPGDTLIGIADAEWRRVQGRVPTPAECKAYVGAGNGIDPRTYLILVGATLVLPPPQAGEPLLAEPAPAGPC